MAAYVLCYSERDVDAVFDSLTEMMLSERREDYFWGALIDLAPSTLFRTFGDHEIEERVRFRFERICADYGNCGFFAILRGRRYCGNGEFRCEDGIYGALKLLASGYGEGCSLRLSTDDTVECSNRIFVWDTRGSCGFPLFPCDITRSSFFGGTVALCCDHGTASGVRKRFLKALYGDFSENYRVIGWVSFPHSHSDGIDIYRVNTPERRARRVTVKAMDGDIGDKAFFYAKRPFLEEGGLSVGRGERVSSDRLAALLFAYTAIGDVGAIDTVNLREKLSDTVKTLRFASFAANGSAGFLRIALLVASAFCEGMGGYGEEFYTLASEMRDMAEVTRLAYESGRASSSSPFLPAEMLAFHVSGDGKRRFFAGFTAPIRLCDRFIYLFSASGERLDGTLRELISGGFGERGIERGGAEDGMLNSLLLSVCAERKKSTFSRIVARVPELRACRTLIYSLP